MLVEVNACYSFALLDGVIVTWWERDQKWSEGQIFSVDREWTDRKFGEWMWLMWKNVPDGKRQRGKEMLGCSSELTEARKWAGWEGWSHYHCLGLLSCIRHSGLLFCSFQKQARAQKVGRQSNIGRMRRYGLFIDTTICDQNWQDRNMPLSALPGR